jgi:hypothetical protein
MDAEKMRKVFCDENNNNGFIRKANDLAGQEGADWAPNALSTVSICVTNIGSKGRSNWNRIRKGLINVEDAMGSLTWTMAFPKGESQPKIVSRCTFPVYFANWA